MLKLRSDVVSAVAHTPYVNEQVDRTRISILYRYAAFAHASHGRFEPRHLHEDFLVGYWVSGCDDLTPRSRDKALSTLRTIAAQQAFADGLLMRRTPTSAPYDEVAWATLRSAAYGIVERALRDDANLLLDLSGEVGLRGSEINTARGTDLSLSAGRMTVTVGAASADKARMVPILGDTAHRLCGLVGSDQHLLRPDYRNRKNVVSSLVTRLCLRDGTFTGFRAAAARNRWIARLLELPIDHKSLLYLAGLESDSHTLYDIWAHLEPADPRLACEAFVRAVADRPRIHGNAHR